MCFKLSKNKQVWTKNNKNNSWIHALHKETYINIYSSLTGLEHKILIYKKTLAI